MEIRKKGWIILAIAISIVLLFEVLDKWADNRDIKRDTEIEIYGTVVNKDRRGILFMRDVIPIIWDSQFYWFC